MNVEINADRENLQINKVQDMLSKVTWSPGITMAEVLKGIQNSAFVVGAYYNGQQIGFMRVVSDKVRFAYLMDVVVDENFRKQGIGQKMVNYTLSHPELKDVYQWFLQTKDAHSVYEKCGFKMLEHPDKWMGIVHPRPERGDFKE